jgi:hypothetical protein
LNRLKPVADERREIVEEQKICIGEKVANRYVLAKNGDVLQDQVRVMKLRSGRHISDFPWISS